MAFWMISFSSSLEMFKLPVDRSGVEREEKDGAGSTGSARLLCGRNLDGAGTPFLMGEEEVGVEADGGRTMSIRF